MARVDVHGDRATQLVQTLEQQREQQGAYPLTVEQLRDRVDPTLADADLFKALAHKSLSGRLILAGKKDLASPIAFAEDTSLLASHPLLLHYALGKLASADKPLHPVDKLVGKVDKSLQEPFRTALEQLPADGLPTGVGRRLVRDKVLFYLEQYPPARSPLEQHADQFLDRLEQRRQAGESVVRLADLVEADRKPGDIKKVLELPEFQARAIVLPVSKTVSLVAATSDRDTLLTGDLLLVELLRARTTTKKPFLALDDLTQALPGAFREEFLAAWQRGRACPGVVTRQEQGRSLVALEENLSPLDLLRDHVLADLHARRTEGLARYPASLADLLATTSADEELRAKLLADKHFKNAIVQAMPGQPDTLVVLAEDADSLARSPRLLEQAVERLSTAETPLHPLPKIVGLLDKGLRPAFEAAVADMLRDQTLPASLVLHELKGKPHLRLARHELPPPPRPAEEVLAGKLLAQLRETRDSGRYPPTLWQLLEKVGARPGDRVVKTALGLDQIKVGMVIALPGVPGSPVALAGDQDQFLADPQLLTRALAAVCTPDDQAISLADLGKRVVIDIREPFLQTIEHQLASDELPDGVGCLRIKKKPHLFLTTKQTAEKEEPPMPTSGLADFGRMFDEAFEKLDHGRNLVSLVELRDQLNMDRDAFDRHLDGLRRTGQYSLSGAEGRGGLSEDERQAGIREHDQLLLFVSRRQE